MGMREGFARIFAVCRRDIFLISPHRLTASLSFFVSTRTAAPRMRECVIAIALLVAVPMAAMAETTLRIGKAQAENFYFIALEVGNALGIFAKHGLAAETYNFGGSAKLQQGLAADAVDLGLGSGP